MILLYIWTNFKQL